MTKKKATKFDSKKPDLSLIPEEALEAASIAYMVGEKKYGRYNYCDGHKASKLIGAIMRHACDWFHKVQENCPKDGQPHLGAIIAGCGMILRQQKLKTLIDDRYRPPTKRKKKISKKT